MENNEELLKNVIFDNGLKALRKTNKMYLKSLSINNRNCVIETINLLQQANKTIQNVNRLLKNNEIVDSATLMRSCIEKIAMAMMIYFDPENIYVEFKDLKKCGLTKNTRPSNLVNAFSGKLKEISPFLFDEFSSDELCKMLNESYGKLCLYTHSSIAVSLMIEVNENDDIDLFIIFFYSISYFLEILLYCCLKYLCGDTEKHVDLICLFLGWMSVFSKINERKVNFEHLKKYKEYLYSNINYDFNCGNYELLTQIERDAKEFTSLINNNSDLINDYLMNLLQENE